MNMERWRWLPRDPGPRHVIVNRWLVSRCDLDLASADVAPLTLRAIVGDDRTAAPTRRALARSTSWCPIRRGPYQDAWRCGGPMLPQLRAVIRRRCRRRAYTSRPGATACFPKSIPAAADRLAVPIMRRISRLSRVRRAGPANSLGRDKVRRRTIPWTSICTTRPARDLFDG